MKKKWIMAGGAVGISAIVMAVTGLSAMADSSGYDAYKTALKTSHLDKSVSVQGSVLLQDNGQTLAGATGNVKANLADRTGSGSVDVTSGAAKKTVSYYKQSGQVVVKTSDSDTYYVEQEKNGGKREKADKENNQVLPQQVETVIDALVGNLKDQVSLTSNDDGSKVVSLQLDQAHIPAVVNALAPIVLKQAARDHQDGEKKMRASEELPFGPDFLQNKPQLSSDIQLQNIAVKATIDADNHITHQEADLTVSGKDDAGAAHVVSLHLSADLSGM